ncbi:MAG: alpha/beta hydrolase [Caldiserica bacterium]|nr:alpha/beta hydrolase [Caldisericota bacterium]
MSPEELRFRGRDGLPLRGYLWPSLGNGLLTIVHGYGEHARRYGAFAGWLAARGWNVAALDLRGHGASGGRRGHVSSFRQYLDDLDVFRDVIRRKVDAAVAVVLGHSLGGLIVARYLEEGDVGIDAAVLSSPALRIAIHVPRWKRALARWASHLIPWLSLPSGIDAASLSHDPEVVEAYRRDPLVHRVATARWFVQTLVAQREALARARTIEIPLLVIVGGADRMVSLEAIEEFMERCGSRRKKLLVYEGFYHEPLNEIDRARVWKDILDWLEAIKASCRHGLAHRGPNGEDRG